MENSSCESTDAATIFGWRIVSEAFPSFHVSFRDRTFQTTRNSKRVLTKSLLEVRVAVCPSRLFSENLTAPPRPLSQRHPSSRDLPSPAPSRVPPSKAMSPIVLITS
ncbi:hypothetical protein BaRGS_00003101 [Batillaria attramentaria]|uniref:Uncharacterized protein n=1 Tax=Batillaria attramentaria TaxID=370345 RepID=A0ABD0M2M9_9CAEN